MGKSCAEYSMARRGCGFGKAIHIVLGQYEVVPHKPPNLLLCEAVDRSTLDVRSVGGYLIAKSSGLSRGRCLESDL